MSRVDVTDSGTLDELESAIQERWGALDGLVCAFGVGALLPIQRLSMESAASLVNTNLLGVVAICKTLFRLLSGGEKSAVVLFSSTMASVGASGMHIYSASKGAIDSLTKSLAIEWAPRKIRVNAVSPGIIYSPLVEQMFRVLTPEQIDAVRARHPLGFGTPDCVAGAVSFLLSTDADWITGAVLPVDGGYTAQ